MRGWVHSKAGLAGERVGVGDGDKDRTYQMMLIVVFRADQSLISLASFRVYPGRPTFLGHRTRSGCDRRNTFSWLSGSTGPQNIRQRQLHLHWRHVVKILNNLQCNHITYPVRKVTPALRVAPACVTSCRKDVESGKTGVTKHASGDCHNSSFDMYSYGMELLNRFLRRHCAHAHLLTISTRTIISPKA